MYSSEQLCFILTTLCAYFSVQDISTNEEDIDELENQLKEARFILAESGTKNHPSSHRYIQYK
jgi:hypothetical protein